MRLNEIRIGGFGCLVERSFQFSPGLNLVFGYNEAGKSTLQRAILALLYGFFRDGRISKADRNIPESLAPWETGAQYGGTLIYSLDDDQSYKATRSFVPSYATQIATNPEGKDITHSFKSASHGRLFFTDDHVGMSKEVFENTCTVRQAELVALESSADAIADTLMRLSASASAEATVTDALDCLGQALKDQVGTRRSWTKPLAKSIKRLGDLVEQRQTLERGRSELSSKSVELNRLTEELERLEFQRKRFEYLEARVGYDSAQRHLEEIESVQQDVTRLTGQAGEWERWATFPSHLRDQVAALASRRDHLDEGSRATREAAERAEQQLPGVKAEIEALQNSLAVVEGAKDTPAGALSNLQRLASGWQMSERTKEDLEERVRTAKAEIVNLQHQVDTEQEELSSLIRLGRNGLAELRQQVASSAAQLSESESILVSAEEEWNSVGMDEGEFLDLKERASAIQAGEVTPPNSRRGCSNLFGLLGSGQETEQPSVDLLTYSQMMPTYSALVRAREDVKSAREASQSAELRITEQLGTLSQSANDDELFDILQHRLDQYLHEESDLKRRQEVLDSLESELISARSTHDSAAKKLQTELDRLNIQADQPLDAVSLFTERCEQKTQYELLKAELARLNLQVEGLQSELDNLDKKQAELKQLDQELRDLLRLGDIDCTADDLDEGVEAFEAGVKNREQWEDAKINLDAAVEHRNSLIRTRDISSLKKTLEALEAQMNDLCSENSGFSELEPDGTARDYQSAARELDSDVTQTREAINRLRDEIRYASAAGKHLAELDEEIHESKEHVDRLKSYGAALELASDELSEATREFQKQFAPKLETLMSEGLERATDRRYSEVRIDSDSLAVSVTAPELQDWISAEALSTGTRDLLYLMLRIGIVRLMSDTGEKLPLLLDDPLVQCDRARQQHALEFLAHLADTTQIVFFTKDEWTREWFEQNLVSDSAHALHILQ